MRTPMSSYLKKKQRPVNTMEELPPGTEALPPDKKPLLRRERHLASAITTTEIDYMTKHHDNHAALRPQHKRILNDVGSQTILPASNFLAWSMSNLEDLCEQVKEDTELLRRAERIAGLATSISYEHFYKTQSPEITSRAMPVTSLEARLYITFINVISQIAQSFEPRQVVQIGKHEFVFDAEICYLSVNSHFCYVIPYSLFLCLSDMCSSWFSISCYTSIQRWKYPGFDLQDEVKKCMFNMRHLIITNK